MNFSVLEDAPPSSLKWRRPVRRQFSRHWFRSTARNGLGKPIRVKAPAPGPSMICMKRVCFRPLPKHREGFLLNENEVIYLLSRRGFHLYSRLGHCERWADPGTFAFQRRG